MVSCVCIGEVFDSDSIDFEKFFGIVSIVYIFLLVSIFLVLVVLFSV